MRKHATLAIVLFCCAAALAQSPPASQPGVGRFPHIEVDVRNKRVRVDCEALHCESPLEFFCVGKGGNEHESVIRSLAKPSQIHTALLMIGMEAGEPIKYSEATKKWFPPHGPPINITMEWDKDGKHYSMPAYKLMRDIKSKKSMPAMSWIFAGSRVMQDGTYAADVNLYVVSICNFEMNLIDVPNLVSSANETLEWEAALDLLPALGSPMTMVLEPVDAKPDSGKPAAPGAMPATSPSAHLSDVMLDQELINRVRQRWDKEVKPHGASLREAAQAEYEVLASLRREQQRLIDEADRIQRLIDQLEHEYQQMTTPRPDNPQN